MNLVILDACRDNPFQRGGKSIRGKGLAPTQAAVGTLLLYATLPGETASDNPRDRNGPFTRHLLAALEVPGLKVEDAVTHRPHYSRPAGQRQRRSGDGLHPGRLLPDGEPGFGGHPELRTRGNVREWTCSAYT